MKKNLPFSLLALIILYFIFSSCSRKNYASTYFDQQTANHKIIAVVPAEIIFTGKQPKNYTAQQIDSIEEDESKSFQVALQNSILRYANTRRYYMRVGMQDLSTTLSLLDQNKISIRDSWKMDAKELAKLLKVDAVVRMQITKQRYMSDYASYGVNMAERILWNTGAGGRIPLPDNAARTNDIYVTCNLLSDNVTLWNDYYKRSSDWNTPANIIIGNITDHFGENFPYKTRR
ncbi:MAG: hypothetical protein ACM3H8_12820 [Sphingobacteriales bacterium]